MKDVGGTGGAGAGGEGMQLGVVGTDEAHLQRMKVVDVENQVHKD